MMSRKHGLVLAAVGVLFLATVRLGSMDRHPAATPAKSPQSSDLYTQKVQPLFDQRCIIYSSSICYDAYGVNDIIRINYAAKPTIPLASRSAFGNGF